MLVAAFVLLIAAGMVAAGVGYVRTARSMRRFRPTSGRITSRDVVAVAGDTREARFGRGGGHAPSVTYDYEVDGVAYSGGRISYATKGLRRSAAAEKVAAIPEEVTVWFDPADPGTAYLERHSPGLGWVLVSVGTVIALAAIGWIAGAV